MSETVIVKSAQEKYQTLISTGNHTIIADEKTKAGGGDTGMNPFELLLSSLGACTSVTLRMYADRKGWNLKALTVELSMDRIDNSTTFYRKITLEGDLSEEQRARLLKVAQACPVAKILEGQAIIHSDLVT